MTPEKLAAKEELELLLQDVGLILGKWDANPTARRVAAALKERLLCEQEILDAQLGEVDAEPIVLTTQTQFDLQAQILALRLRLDELEQREWLRDPPTARPFTPVTPWVTTSEMPRPHPFLYDARPYPEGKIR